VLMKNAFEATVTCVAAFW